MTDRALLEKYDVPGPRYTSYPTVPEWTGAPSPARWLDELRASLDAAGGRGAGIYVHIPFCRSLCAYCGCNTRISRNPAVAAPYVRAVHREWSLYREALAPAGRLPVAELHLGGGTPTFLPADALEALLEPILDGVALAPDAELSLEADPRTTTRAQLRMLARLGFRRISFGVQDFDPVVQEAVHRVQPVAMVEEITREARDAGFSGVNYDLIHGLPFQTPEGMSRTFEEVARLRPDRVAFYSYAHVPWLKPAHRRFTEADLPRGAAKRALYEAGRERLGRAGYREIGMDHFALPEDPLHRARERGELHRSFMGYTARRPEPLLGLGVSSIGTARGALAQNEKSVEAYEAALAEGRLPLARGHVLTDEDRSLREHILSLMTRFETSWTPLDAAEPFLSGVPARLEELARDGLVLLGERSCRVTPRGAPFVRNVCMAFDARLEAGERRFSRTV
jgi:oxygen-independent coproporphyrinogen-3 oxidase